MSKQEKSLFIYRRSRAEMHTQRERAPAASPVRGVRQVRSWAETPPEMPWVKRARWGGDASHSRVTVPPSLFTFGQLPSFVTPDWSMDPPRDACTTFLLKRIPPQRSMGVCPHLLWGEVPSLLDPREASLHTIRQGRLPWPQEWASYLFALAELSFCHYLCLGVSGGEQKLSFTPRDKHQASSPEAHCLPPHNETISFPVSGLWLLIHSIVLKLYFPTMQVCNSSP